MAKPGKGLWPQPSHFQPAGLGGGGAGGMEKEQQDVQMITGEKGGCGVTSSEETIWRLGEKFPFWHMTHEALSPFCMWSHHPTDWGWPASQPLSLCPAVQPVALCPERLANLLQTGSQIHGFLDANTIPGNLQPILQLSHSAQGRPTR